MVDYTTACFQILSSPEMHNRVFDHSKNVSWFKKHKIEKKLDELQVLKFQIPNNHTLNWLYQ